MSDVNKFLFVSVSVVLIIASRGYAASLAWNSFVPQYFNAPNLPTLMAIALISLLHIVMPVTVSSSENDKDYAKLIVVVISPWVAYIVVLVTTSIYF